MVPAETTRDNTPSQTSQVMSQYPQINAVNIAHPRFVLAEMYTDLAASENN